MSSNTIKLKCKNTGTIKSFVKEHAYNLLENYSTWELISEIEKPKDKRVTNTKTK